MEFNVLDDDELDAFNLIVFGIPRQINIRPDYFHAMDELSFYKRFRLPKQSVLQLLPLIEQHLEIPFNINNSVSPMDQLLICLRFYATGNHLLGIGDFGKVHVSTVSRIVRRVSEAIASLYDRFIYFPKTQMETRDTQLEFFRKASFPRIIGAVDGTHVRIQSPGNNDAEVFRNRKSYFSINVQVICNANLEAMDVVARWPGSSHDATIFNSSRITARFERGEFANSLLLGDSGYHAKPFLVTPLLNPRTRGEILYNEAHIRTRNTVERFFGNWKRRFPVLAYGCRLKLETTLIIIIATAVLQNIARKRGDYEPPLHENINIEELEQLIRDGHIPHVHDPNAVNHAPANLVRTELINYFANR